MPKDVNDKKEKDRVYKYNELVDLNDKLTLVVGKDDQQQEVIRYFADVSSSRFHSTVPMVSFHDVCGVDRSSKESFHSAKSS